MKNLMEESIDAFMDDFPEMMRGHEWEWVVYQGRERTDFYHCEQDALREGYRKFGVDKPFLLRQVSIEFEIWGKYGMPIKLDSIATGRR